MSYVSQRSVAPRRRLAAALLIAPRRRFAAALHACTFGSAAAALALALSPLGASAQPHGDKTHSHPHAHPQRGPGASAPHGGAPKDAYKPTLPPGAKAKGEPGAQGEAAAPKPAATLPPSPEVAKAVDGLSANCPKAGELRQRIEAVAAQRKASIAAIRTAQNEARKQLRLVTTAKQKIERAVKKPGGADTTADFESARTAHAAAVAQNAAIASEHQKLRASEDELAAIAASADEAAAACAAAEATLRMAAAEARKAANAARAESVKARAFARMPPAKALEAARAKQTADLEALQKSTAEASGALDSLRTVAAAAPPAPAPGPKKPAGPPPAK
jgi:hypothetical protein